MKKFILIIIASICVFHSYSQTKVGFSKKIQMEFREEVDPYLQKFAKIGISKANNNDEELSRKTAVRARYNVYLAKIAVLEKRVDESIDENAKYSNDKLFVLKIIEHEYRRTFIGLPQEFWESVEQRVDKL